MLHAVNPEPVAYEFDDTPEPGATTAVAPGILWLRMPLPFAITHINLWLLEDADGWVIVDTGVDSEECQDVWRAVFDETTGRAAIDRVIVTHLHPDHSGSAGWLCRKLDAGLWMSRAEYLLCRVLSADTGRAAPSTGIEFYRAAGFPPQALDRYQKTFGVFGRFVSALPESYARLRDGDTIDVDGRDWEIVVGRGHSPEHACLYCAELNVLISGDQLLPTISSNVSVYPTEPLADPLADWLDSLRRMKDRVPADVLVLPAHGRPFRGAHHRLDQLIEEHDSCLAALTVHCREPRLTVDVFPVLFKGPIKDGNLIMATGESIAHLNYLMHQGIVERFADDAGVYWYRSLTG